MNRIMHYMFLIEDASSEILVRILMDRIADNREDITYDCKSFRGIGGFTPKNTVKETRTNKLLNDLATYLRGFDRSLQGFPAVIVVVVDNDDRDPADFKQEMHHVAEINNIRIDHVFCIAVEEMEAWLLGDSAALQKAYPNARNNVLQRYEQDSICGTWELLADAIYSGGRKKMMALPYGERGKIKAEWAKNIGQYMIPEDNVSPSFRNFMQEIQKRIPVAV